MPIYSYKCKECQHEEETVRRISEREEPALCPKCGGSAEFILSPGPKPTDHLYPRVVENFDHNPVVVNSLREYYREQKKRGLIDGGKPRGVKGQWY
jgi:putative FmdB family regulatory protein